MLDQGGRRSNVKVDDPEATWDKGAVAVTQRINPWGFVLAGANVPRRTKTCDIPHSKIRGRVNLWQIMNGTRWRYPLHRTQ